MNLTNIRKLVSKLNKEDKIAKVWSKKKPELIEDLKKVQYELDEEKQQLTPTVQMKRKRVIKLTDSKTDNKKMSLKKEKKKEKKIKIIKKKEKVLEEDEYNEISIKGNIFFYKQVGKSRKDLEIFNELGNVPSAGMQDKVKQYLFNKTFKKKVDAEYKKELKQSAEKNKQKEKERLEKQKQEKAKKSYKDSIPLQSEYVKQLNAGSIKNMNKKKK